MKKNQEQLINNISGQLEGVKKMMKAKKDCFSILIQMKAIKSSLERVMIDFIQENFVDCATKIGKKDKEKMKKLLQEIIKN